LLETIVVFAKSSSWSASDAETRGEDDGAADEEDADVKRTVERWLRNSMDAELRADVTLS